MNIDSGLNIDELEMKVAENIGRIDSNLTCKICGKISSQMSNMKTHVETHIDGVSCGLCDKKQKIQVKRF